VKEKLALFISPPASASYPGIYCIGYNIADAVCNIHTALRQRVQGNTLTKKR